ncbi:DNA repair protein RecN (Recombination protein N) [Mesoflavibacter sabulilitoris]|uniref:DNA repair protein RecN n=1 Tax=Mesoflavibacter zeaxanthinifaciens subsp. sabulilitoris TaxID=1520893 RepID=A0A2T1NH49_9FLAO|nr:DNA repair protein RecN [Mesoflavibacter zeaxanthinifaciens]MBB3122705.1 DNA repair protein RecN (Recombination protein N) [Mesoflavibacter zeaxanthinifaciens subsp. sabulilitoris]PSG92207.1 DNA repair protein RecN [Mesoflavibacter zeaxanthinifaciens subsp. sabulilitoris]
MLTGLSIKNYALIDQLQVNFNDGFTIITGETGAGKSILLGGLSLILGKRADLSSLRDTEKKCIIEATFDISNYNLKSLFIAEDLDYEAQTIIRREILPSGKSRAFVNDSPVKLNSLQLLGEKLIDIHSQHETLQLTDDNFQFQVIDALAETSENLVTYKEYLKTYKSLQKELKQLQQFQAEAIKEHDYNSFLLNELVSANLKPDELAELEEEFEVLSNVESIQEKLESVNQLLSEEQIGVLTNLREVKNTMQKLALISANYKDLSERVNSALIELDDVATEVEGFQTELDVNPKRLEEVEGKLSAINNLMQKHIVQTIPELIEIREQLAQKVEATENVDKDILNKEKEIKAVVKQLDSEAAIITKKRNEAIPKLITQLEDILSQLGMPNAQFKITLNKSEIFLFNGKDELDFLFSANKGGQFNMLKKAASGGELSRIMLAIKSILSKYIKLPSIIFDEIDTGVSGEISNKMAEIMSQMSQKMQVFSITHLPQIAAKGNTHFKVYKQDIDNVTTSNLVKLEYDERVVELAQMLGGAALSESAIAHAKQLLN